MRNTTKKLDFSTILASSVHDMKNSLAMLLGSLSGISTNCAMQNCSIKNELSRIKHEGLRVNRDLVQLLTLYKIEKEQYFLNTHEVTIYDYLEEILIDYKSLLDDRGIDIALACDDELLGYFDAELVSGILRTILNNAYQYTKDKILLKGELINGYIKISIHDNGQGYPEQMLFDQAIHKTGSNFGTGSTGLGLYFSEQVAELHRNKNKTGFIQITNAENKTSEYSGGCFSIYLP